MILQSLNRLYDRLAADDRYRLPPPGYSKQEITFEIALNSDGSLNAINDARLEEVTIDKSGNEKRKKKPILLSVPGEARPSEASLSPGFLWDDTRFVLGWHSDSKKDAARIHQCFQAFVQRHNGLLAEIPSDTFAAVCSFLRHWSPNRVNDYPALVEIGKGRCVFRMVGHRDYAHDDSVIKKWWSEHSPIDSDQKGYCLITGLDEKQDIARLHLGIFGLPGTPYTGAALSSFNCDSFTSYGKSKNDNSPVSISAAFRFGNALNALLDGPQSHFHKIRIGEVTAVFWTERESAVESLFAEFLDGSFESENARGPAKQDETLRQNLETFLRILRQGGGAQVTELGDDPNSKFHILGLSLSQGRLSVRFWHVGSIAQMVDRLKAHYDALRIVRRRDADPEFPPFWMLLRQTAREAKDIPPLLSGALVQSVLSGTPYPQAFYNAVINRIRADHVVNYLRAAIIKAFLTRQPNSDHQIPMSLDPNRTDKAYLFGRLFAALEKTQEDALPGINATIRERFYSSASATPAAVFPRLLRTYQHHLASLEGGHKVNRERLVQSIHNPLDSYPAHLNLEEQGLFAIGYYHQRQDFFRKKTPSNENPSSPSDS
jgi:CRISPR-associated protein Csd1